MSHPNVSSSVRECNCLFSFSFSLCEKKGIKVHKVADCDALNKIHIASRYAVTVG